MDDIAEWAALYVAGALTPEEVAEFERRLDDPRVVAELRNLDGVAKDLYENTPSDAPPVDTLNALLARMAPTKTATVDADDIQVWKEWNSDSAPGMTVRRAGEGGWDEIGIPGIRVRRLFVDTPRNQVTFMVQMAPGTAYPRHRHDGVEECYVLQGDLSVGDELTLHAGDYQRCELDTVHGIQSTKNGCTLLLVSSMTDDLI